MMVKEYAIAKYGDKVDTSRIQIQWEIYGCAIMHLHDDAEYDLRVEAVIPMKGELTLDTEAIFITRRW